MDVLQQIQRALRYPPRVIARRALSRATAMYRVPFARRADLAARGLWTEERFWEAIDVPLPLREAAIADAFENADAVLPLPEPAVESIADALRHDPAAAERCRAAAAEAAQHRFDYLGSGLTRVGDDGAIDWHVDWRTGRRWDAATWYRDIAVPAGGGADIKLPRELSRFHHLSAMGFAARLGDPAEADALRREAWAQLASWVESNPFRFGVNWQSTMDVALRACNWLLAIPVVWPQGTMPTELKRLLLHQVYLHGRHIEANLEFYDDGLTGNHYLSNVIGLLAIGAACPEFPESDRWVAFGLQELASELPHQVRADGTHVEDSSHYHRLVLEMFLAGTALAGRLPPGRRARIRECDTSGHKVRPPLAPLDRQPFRLDADAVFSDAYYGRLAAMADVTRLLTKPDGRVPQFGDNDNSRLFRVLPRGPERRGDFSDHRDLVALADAVLRGRTDESLDGVVASALTTGMPRVSVPVRLPRRAPETDAAVRRPVVEWRLEWDADADPAASCSWTVLPDGGYAVARGAGVWLAVTFRGASVSGHGHNDQLSFVLDLAGEPVVVDPGSCVYTSAPAQRNRYRATPMHNTIAFDGREQNEWETGPRGLFEYSTANLARLVGESGGKLTLELPSYGRHVRTFAVSPSGLRIDDAFDGGAPWTGRFHLAPGVIAALDNGAVVCRTAAGRTVRLHGEGARLRVERYQYSPAYGRLEDAAVVVGTN